MKKARENQLTYLFTGILMVTLGVYLNYRYIIQLAFPESMMIFFLGTSSLMMAYLSPHLFPKDERSTEIIGKSMSINYFVLFGTITLLFILTASFVPVVLTAAQVLIILFCIMCTSIPLTMIFYANKM